MKLHAKVSYKMKKQLLTIGVITLLMAGQSTMADTSDNDFTPFDEQAINQVTDNRLNITTTESTMPVASYMSKHDSSADYYSLDYSHE